MDIDEFLEKAQKAGLQLPAVHAGPTSGRAPESIDALFHIPLLALAIMVISRRSPFRTVLLGRQVGMLLVEHFAALRKTSDCLETSLTLRKRCADALAFLEAFRLVDVSHDSQRIVTLTKIGKNHIERQSRNTSDLGLLVRQLNNSQGRVSARVGADER